MGEKIKVLSQANVGSSVFDIELNKESFIGGPRYVHIQNSTIRYNMTEVEFLQIATAIIKAEKQLLRIKGLEV